MPKVALVAIAVALAGCASTREERAAAFRKELPQLVAACNAWTQSDVIDGQVTRGDGLKACSRLRDENSLRRLADPAAVSAYLRYTQGPRWSNEAAAAAGSFPPSAMGAPSGMTTIYGPGGAPQ